MLRDIKGLHVRHFLERHGFPDLHGPRSLGGAGGCVRMEEDYAIHVAAEDGDDETVRLLLELGADPESVNSQGLTALDLAQLADVNGSHLHVMRLLHHAVQSRVRSVTF